ncbi:MAG: CYTH domain-containing protein [Candidatus Marinimicrobia bacterium]|nr:CYTH domain-containing protein [Candidatus Neomarinimicrobiota bacterium]MCF7850961.1 CYTH domain-containing protein [Candidatus Neomarinimicrobiota bacterium]MCF7905023.1 CYTH domain-containing protein [Candidatus Neomarinimicrobiota bacterium]
MENEIERKFLVTSDVYRTLAQGEAYKQGYLNSDKERVIRIRTKSTTAFLTIKTLQKGLVRKEFEYQIPLDHAEYLLEHVCERPIIEKTRYHIDHGDHTWEVDEFHGENEGLIIAEVELEAADEDVVLPDWIGKEVSDDWRYYNSNLLQHPFNLWKSDT